MRSLRTGFMKSFALLEDWLLLVLSPVDDSELPTDVELRSLWCSLAVSADLLEPLLSMKLIWRDGRLLCHDAFLQEAGWAETLSHVLMSLWSIPAWTASRWLTIGASARCFLAASLTGFEHMFHFLRTSKAASEYDMHGFDRLDVQGRQLLASTALVSLVSESFLASVLADSRVALHAFTLHQDVLDELHYLETLDAYVWKTLASVVPMEHATLRHMVIRGGMSTLGYLQDRVFSTTSALPWSLVRGDISVNLQGLLEQDAPPEEPVASKIWHCGHAGMARCKLVQVIELLGQ
eukprot:6476077-Amphidinium_carterae.1